MTKEGIHGTRVSGHISAIGFLCLILKSIKWRLKLYKQKVKKMLQTPSNFELKFEKNEKLKL